MAISNTSCDLIALAGLDPLESLPSLSKRTEAFYQDYLKNASPEIIRMKEISTKELLASGIGERCLQVGGQIPDFSLPTASGRIVSAAALLDAGPLVISFYRGGWCGYCNLELNALQEIYPYLKICGANLVAICPELPTGIEETIELQGLEFDILVDAGNTIATAFGLSYPFDPALRTLYCEKFDIDIPKANGDNSYLLPITATYLIDTDGYIRIADTNPDHTKRLEPRSLVEALLTQRILAAADA
jgi:peroxiredoxin